MSDNYAGLSIYHKRKIVAANKLAQLALTFLASQGNNNLCRSFTNKAISYSNTISDHEVNEEIAKLDELVEAAKSSTKVTTLKGRRKTRSLFR